jgi:drug/metabolite transporter (DMT)-like permease
MSRKSWFMFLGTGFLWGIPYLLIALLVDDAIPASIVVVSRTVIGAAVLIPVAAKKGTLKPALKAWKYVLPYAIGEMFIPWILITNAEKHINSGLAGLLIATVPIWSTIMASLKGDKTVWHSTRLLGMLIGFIGIVLVVGVESLTGKADLLSIIMVLIPAVTYAWAVIMVNQKIPHIDPIAINGIAMAMTALFYLPIALFQLPDHMISGKSVAALTALGLFPTALAFVIFFILIKDIGPARASLVTYLNTAFAVVLGIIFHNESPTIGTYLGLPLVLIGSYFASRKLKTISQ